MTTDERNNRVRISGAQSRPARAGAKRPAGLLLICVGWPVSMFVLLAGYRELLSEAGLSGAGLVAVFLLSVPFAVFLTIGANTWCLGAIEAARRRVPDGLRWPDMTSAANITVTTAIVFPIKNEDTAQVFGNIAAIGESLGEAGAEHLFDIYVISNSDDPNCWVEEELAWYSVSRMFDRVHYWRRHRKLGKKPANIAEFCERWGSRYEYMVVLDADSLMSADCLLTLVGLMQANPQAALMQTAPNIIKGQTLWARLQQFTIWSNARIVQWGERAWQGAAGAYYGHNAIIRLAPFMQHCGLPRIPGRPPFGGDILSHDFVEAALLSRAGWEVWLVPELEGSYEECPPTFDAYFRRDRRWFQGDFVNVRLVGTTKLPPAGRIRFAMAALRDVSTPLLLLLCGLIIGSAHSPGFGAAAIFVPLLVWDFAARQSWAGVPAIGFGISVYNKSVTRQRLPVLRSFANRILDQLLWLTTTPTRLLTHALFVAELAYGRDAGWTTLRRTAGMSTRSQSVGLYFSHTLFGVTVSAVLFFTDSWALWWLSPVLLCWICTIPIARTFASRHVGLLARRAGILLIPEENVPPPIIVRSEVLGELLRRELPPQPWRAALTDDIAIAVHRAFLAHAAPLTDHDRRAAASAAEKYRTSTDAERLDLTDAEKTALLQDPDDVWRNPPPPLSLHYPAAVPLPMPEQQLIRTRSAPSARAHA
ncbi:glucans biosynthesis glucosyltransferase MdoH [Nocardia sp. NPDC051570]|uniref:glucans biosynthesis glucosyltransferase MdoH n=1 Tax=Nocardia sp. NPDC051570 TaxID=3364324 RepID=UPI0037BD0F78